MDIKKGPYGPFFTTCNKNYLLLMYIVTSKPKRMSLYSGVSHFIIFLLIDVNLKFIKLKFRFYPGAKTYLAQLLSAESMPIFQCYLTLYKIPYNTKA